MFMDGYIKILIYVIKNYIKMEKLLETLEKSSNEYTDNLIKLSKLRAEDPDKNKKIINDLDFIGNLGFTNSVGVKVRNNIINEAEKFNKSISAACTSIQLIHEVRSYFGENALVIKLDDFIDIIKRYKLVCGMFSNYTSIVPDKNALEIKDAIDKIDHLEEHRESFPQLYKCYYKYKTVFLEEFRVKYGYKLSKSEIKTLDIFPISIYSTHNCHYRSDSERDICSFLDTYRNTDISYEYLTRIDYEIIPNSLFICAPRNQMNNSNKKVKFSILPPPTEDPLICTLAPNGSIIILSMWGKEAEDKMLNKYKEIFPNL